MPAARADAQVEDAHASVLVFGADDNGFEVENAASSLESLGLTVDTADRMPADVSGYDALWYVEAYTNLTGDEEAKLANFISAGGSAYLTGERPCCEPLNGSVKRVLDDVLVNKNVQVGGMGDINGPFTFNPEATDGLARVPNALADFVPKSPGGMQGVGGVSGRNVFAASASVTVGAVWNESDMESAKGRVVLLMDIDWLGSSDRLPIIQNIQNFLSKGVSCGPSDDSGITWTPATPKNCSALISPYTATFAATGTTAAPELAVDPTGVTTECGSAVVSGKTTTLVCKLSGVTTGAGSLIVHATEGAAQTSRFFTVRPKNDSRNVPVPFALDSNWWDWPDRDDDGLPDNWETDGVWVKGKLLDLPSQGADPDHKDLFVHFDFDEGEEFPEGVFDNLRASFAASPLTNPDSTTGVNLHVQRGASIPSSVIGTVKHTPAFFQRLTTYSGFSTSPEFGGNGVPHIYKYMVNAHPIAVEPNPQGKVVIGTAEVKGTYGWTAWNPDEWTAALEIHTSPDKAVEFAQASNVMHEMGHLLGLLHHGADSEPTHDKNYKSIMSYQYSNFGVTSGLGNVVHKIDYSRTNQVNLDWSVAQSVGKLTFVPGQFGEDPDLYLDSNNEAFELTESPTEPTIKEQLKSADPEDFKTFAEQFELTATPDFPTAQNASGSGVAGTPITIDLKGSDPGGKPLTFELFGTPAHGKAEMLDGDTLKYTPDDGFVGSDAVDFKATNGTLSSSPAAAAFTVTAPPTTSSTSSSTSSTSSTTSSTSSTSTSTTSTTVPAAHQAVVATGAGVGGGPHVRLLNAKTQNELWAVMAYNSLFRGGVNVAFGDIDGDGTGDIVTAPGPGGGPHVKVFSGVNHQEIRSFMAYSSGFTGGVEVAAGDVNGDGFDDIVTGAGPGGGPHVRVFSGKDGHELLSFMAYGSDFPGGVRVAATNVDNDDRADIVTGAGPGGGPHVRAFAGDDAAPLLSQMAYNSAFGGGVFVAGSARSGKGFVTGAGPGGGQHVRIWNAQGDLDAEWIAGDGTQGAVVAAAAPSNETPFNLVVANAQSPSTVRFYKTTPLPTLVDARDAYSGAPVGVSVAVGRL